MLDYNLILSDAQSVTTGATSTYYVDMLSTGFGHNDELYAQFLINTAFTITSGASITCAIMIANETSLASKAVAVSKIVMWDSTNASANYPIATLKIGPDVFKRGSITGVDAPFRYLFAEYTLAGGAVAAGKIDCRLLKDINLTMDKVM